MEAAELGGIGCLVLVGISLAVGLIVAVAQIPHIGTVLAVVLGGLALIVGVTIVGGAIQGWNQGKPK